jgi:hypothetical protein
MAFLPVPNCIYTLAQLPPSSFPKLDSGYNNSSSFFQKSTRDCRMSALLRLFEIQAAMKPCLNFFLSKTTKFEFMALRPF